MGNGTATPSGQLPIYEYQNGYADTWDIGGSRFGFYSSMAFDPDAYVGTSTVVPLAILSAPPTYGQLGGYGPMATNAAASNAAAQPWNPKQSPLPLVILGIAVALYGLHWLYYKERRK
jgi:hypothetical protein